MDNESKNNQKKDKRDNVEQKLVETNESSAAF